MVADDLVFIDGSGKRYGKAFFIDGWTGPDDDYDPVTLTDRVILSLGKDAGLASAEAILSGRAAGKPFRVRIRFTDIFRRLGEGWHARFIQVTLMPIGDDKLLLYRLPGGGRALAGASGETMRSYWQLRCPLT